MNEVKDLGPLSWTVPIVDARSGRPTTEFQRRWEQQRSNNGLIRTIQFGDGAPTGVAEEGGEYIDTGTTPYTLYVGNEGEWHQVGVLDFTDLQDVPHDYTGHGGKLIQVTGAEDGLQFQVNPTANLVFAGPAAGAAALPTFRALVAADLPASVSTRYVEILVTDPNGSAITVGDGKAYFRVPAIMNGLNLTAVDMHVTTVSTSGIPTVQFANITTGFDMLSTKLTVDANETDSSTATTPAVIDAAHRTVTTADIIRIDIDVAGTGTKGLIVGMAFS